MKFASKSIAIRCPKLSRSDLNSRPFMAAEVLHHNENSKLNITRDKERGKDVESAPWLKVFKGERTNDHHIARVERQVAHKEKE